MAVAQPSKKTASGDITNALTVDVEDYFHVNAFASVIKPANWDSYECRVENNTRRILELFAQENVQGTFFVLGWVTKRYPGLIREIMAGGHEIACHGMSHQLVYKQTPDVFRAETTEAKQRLEEVTGLKVRGYRAASYSITQRSIWAIDILQDLGFDYDSSVFPVRHDTYGMPDAPRFPYRTSNGRMLEVPLTTLDLLGYRLPCGGGGYFRIFPYFLFRWALRQVNIRDAQPAVFYLHPWEIDTEQPRVPGASWRSNFRHYTNLSKTAPRLRQLLRDFKWDRMDRVFAVA